MLLSAAPHFYLALNDDALIRDIVSGVYTGAPEARDIQNLWPFGAAVSLLYRAAPGVPWFGTLLLGLEVLCAVSVLLRALAIVGQKEKGESGRRFRRAGMRIAILAVWCFLLLLASPHFFFIQYSVTAGCLASASAFFIVTGEKKRHFAAGVAFAGIAYLIRSEMLLLLLPPVLLALFFRYVREIRASRAENEEMPWLRDFLCYPFVTDHYRRYGVTLIGIFLVLAAGWSLDRIGYASSDWHEFVRFFDARTEVYDFTGVPPYAGNEDFYASIGLSAASAGLLENYNFGLDESIDAETMEAVAAYAAGKRSSAGERLFAAIGEYFYRLHHLDFPADYFWPQTDAPWNLIVLILYLALIALSWLRASGETGIGMRVFRALWQPVLLFVCRSVLWLALLTEGRAPVRVTQPLWFVETAVLAGTLLMQTVGARREVVQERTPVGAGKEDDNAGDVSGRGVFFVRCLTVLALLVIGGVYTGNALWLVRSEQARREAENAPYEALRAYCAANGDVLYFMDVYSSVRETRPLFHEPTGTGGPDNLSLLGGWAVKSPAWREQLDAFGYEDAEEALLSDDVCFVADLDSDVSWLTDYYASKKKTVMVTARATVDRFVVYDVRENAP